MKRRAADRGEEAVELAKEPHGLVVILPGALCVRTSVERKHAEDVLRRVVVYLKAWLQDDYDV